MNAPVLSPSRIPPPNITSFSSSLHGHLANDVFSPVDQNGSFCFDRVIKSGKVARRVKKKGAWKASWKPVYLVLRPNLLSIYGNADETDLKASIALSDITAVARVRKSHQDHVFGVFSPSKNYHFHTLSDQDTGDWVTQIRLEARTDNIDLDPLDPPAPHFSRSATHDGSHVYDTSDISADESPEPALSPSPPRNRNNHPPTTTRPRTYSNIDAYSGPEHTNTSHSDFSDFHLGSSLPTNKSHLLSASNPPPTTNNNNTTNRPLSPIPSSAQLRPPPFSTTHRNPSQLSIDATLAADQTPTTHPTSTTSQPPPTAAAPDRDPLRIIRQGHLTLLTSHPTGLAPKKWKPLWAVLRPNTLSFYKNEQEYSVLKMVPVSSIIDAVEIDPVSRTRVYCFEVIAETKVLRCCVQGEEEMVGWLGGVKSVIAGARREGGSVGGGVGGEVEGVTEGVGRLGVR